MILGCDYEDNQIEKIKPRKLFVETDNGELTPIIQKLSARCI